MSGIIVGTTSATLRLNGKVVATVSGTFTQSVTLTDGKNIIVVSGYVTGWAGNAAYLGTSGIRTVTLDRTPPIVIIDSPSSGSIVNTSGIEVSGTINDPGVSTANLTVNNIWRLIPVVGGSFSQKITLIEGPNTISIKATDKALNTSLPVSVTVTLDASRPRVRITAPKNNLLTNIGGQRVTGTVYDPWITGATLIVNGSPEAIDVAPDGSFSKMVSLKPEATNTIEVTAEDAAHNIGRSSVVNVTVDQTTPKITVGLSDPTDSITITVASNEALIEKPVVSVNATAITMTLIDINQWTGVFEPIPDGKYNVTANATDNADNRATARATFSKQTVTIAVNEVKEVRTETTTLEITTTANVTDASVSLTSTLENPARNVDNPEGAETGAGLFVEIVASPELRDNLESIDIRVDYDEAEILARGIVESSLKLYLWSVTTGQWGLVPGSAANTTANYVYGTITHLSKYGAFGTVTAPAPPPERVEEVIVTAPGVKGQSDNSSGRECFYKLSCIPS